MIIILHSTYTGRPLVFFALFFPLFFLLNGENVPYGAKFFYHPLGLQGDSTAAVRRLGNWPVPRVRRDTYNDDTNSAVGLRGGPMIPKR